MSENLRRYVRTVYALDAVVQRVPSGAWDAPSPCTEWTAREVLGHTMWGIKALTAGARGEARPEPEAEADVAGPDPVATWNVVRDEVLTALDQPGVLDRELESPFGAMSIDSAIGFFYGDPLMHTWDIATAAGIAHGIADDLADANIETLGGAGDALRGPGRLADASVAPPGADGATRMAAFGGRDV